MMLSGARFISRTSRLTAACCAAIVMLAGCGGGGGGAPGIPNAPSITATATPPSAPASGHTASVTFKMKWNDTTPTALRRPDSRGRMYVPANARSVSVTVNGGYTAASGTGTVAVLNSPGTSLTFNAATGSDTFFIQVFDEQNAQGNVLGQALVTQTVSAGSANVVSSIINGVIATVQITIPNASPKAGTPANVRLNIDALDADGDVITGPGDFNTPIQLSINDPSKSGTLSFSASELPNPGFAPVTLDYTGGTLVNATITASAGNATAGTATFAPTPTVYEYALASGNNPQWITAGPDGNMWFTEANPGNDIARITASGTISEYLIPTSNADLQGIVSDGVSAVWAAEYNASKIIKSPISGPFVENGLLFGGGNPVQMMNRGDNTVWYTDQTGGHLGYINVVYGTAGETTVASGSQPFGIAEGTDGNIYYTEFGSNKIGRLLCCLFGTYQDSTALPSVGGVAPQP
ncbi:MAG: hypothetical protein WBD74_05550, partial [Candidatus Aquilonibacter sp.]